MAWSSIELWNSKVWEPLMTGRQTFIPSHSRRVDRFVCSKNKTKAKNPQEPKPKHKGMFSRRLPVTLLWKVSDFIIGIPLNLWRLHTKAGNQSLYYLWYISCSIPCNWSLRRCYLYYQTLFCCFVIFANYLVSVKLPEKQTHRWAFQKALYSQILNLN